MPETILPPDLLFIIGWFAIFFVAERVFRLVPPPKNLERLKTNAGFWLIIVLASPVIVTPLVMLGVNHTLWVRPEIPVTSYLYVATIIVDIILLDLWIYWLHRAYHVLPALWRLHEVHHRDEFLDTTSAVRFHILEVTLSALLRIVPIAIFAVPLLNLLIFEAILFAAAVFHHSNLKLPTRMENVLSLIFVTPSIHWVHHHASSHDTESNYATLLSIWDRLFMTRSSTIRTPEMKIGVEGHEDEGFFHLLLMPLRKRTR